MGFVDLGNPFEVVVHHPLIGCMVSLGHQDGVTMVSALVCMVYTLDKTYGHYVPTCWASTTHLKIVSGRASPCKKRCGRARPHKSAS
uniref:Uncharacterized protein n=1 Tax=Vitis vinifera TaxID=29760 RepID=A5BNK0_VITVI|nr:hypothetical protein VITISV_033137 [Vitis vinifera]